MDLDRDGDELAHPCLDRLRRNLRECAANDLHEILTVTIDDGGNALTDFLEDAA